MKKRIFSTTTATLIITFILFSLTACISTPDNDSSDSADGVSRTIKVEEFSKDNSEVIITRTGTTFFLTENGEVYGAGKNAAFELGLGHASPVQNAVRVPIEGNVIKVSAFEDEVFFFIDTGEIYLTGNPNLQVLDVVLLENESPGAVAYRKTPKQLDLSAFPEKVIDIIGQGNNNQYWFITENGNVYMKYYSDDPVKIDFPEKIISAYTYGDGCWFLSETKKLYGIGKTPSEEYYTTKLKVENVKDVIQSGSLYYITSSGEAYGIYNFSSETDNDFEHLKIKIPEKAEFFIQYGSKNAIVAESGKMYFIGQPDNAVIEGWGDSIEVSRDPKFYENGSIENIDNIDKIACAEPGGNGEESSFSYAIKRSGEAWQICVIGEGNEGLETKVTPINELPEWQ